MATLNSVLKNGDGSLIADEIVTLVALENISPTIPRGAKLAFVTDESGAYNEIIADGRYKVLIGDRYAGEAQIASGTTNLIEAMA